MLWEATPEERKTMATMDWEPTKAEQGHINFRLRLEGQRLDLLFSDDTWMKQLRHDYDKLKQTENHLKHILVHRGLDLGDEIIRRTTPKLPDADTACVNPDEDDEKTTQVQ